jgi:hypothetical protein
METVTVTTAYAGTLAIQSERFAVPLAVAKQVRAYMKREGMLTPGSYWQAHLATPVTRAVRVHDDAVMIYTAGFSTGELANIISAAVPGVRVVTEIDPRTDQRSPEQLARAAEYAARVEEQARKEQESCDWCGLPDGAHIVLNGMGAEMRLCPWCYAEWVAERAAV